MNKKVLAILAVIIILLIFLVGVYLLSLPSRTIEEFSEGLPSWAMSDLAVEELQISPNRTNAGERVNLQASLSNIGRNVSSSADLIFLVDNLEISHQSIDPISPLGKVVVNAAWTAESPGRHRVVAQLKTNMASNDGGIEDKIQTGFIRVFGDSNIPELEVESTTIETLCPLAGESYNLSFNFQNPSFTNVRNIPVKCTVDGAPIGNSSIEYLPTGSTQELNFQWLNVSPGEHIIQIEMTLSEEFLYADEQKIKSWVVTSPAKTVLYDNFQKDKWVSIGPRILTDGAGGNPTGSIGQALTIAFHPTDKDIMYVCTNTGGVWKTTNGGNSWIPLTDKLLPINIRRALAVDEYNGDIIYFGTGSSNVHIYKSINGGTDWTPFLNSSGLLPIIDINKLAIMHDGYKSQNFSIFAATNIGLLRYRSSDPLAATSSPSNWTIIKTGVVDSFALSPVNPNIVYVSVVGEGVLYTDKGLSITKDSDWHTVNLPAITQSLSKYYTFDVFWDTPPKVFAATLYNSTITGYEFAIYESVSPYSSWSIIHQYLPGEIAFPYNPFIRVHPFTGDVVYFGGVGLYKRYISSGQQFKIDGVHDDMHGMEWQNRAGTTDYTPGTYYVCCDGGVWRATVANNAPDTCVSRNYDLRITQFYDFDASKTNTNLMIGGTQDCGTIMYQGTPDWKIIAGGDGAYSVIGPGDNVFYSQRQYLYETSRSDKGVNTKWGDWISAVGTYPHNMSQLYAFDWAGYNWNAYIAVHPKDPKMVFAEGTQLYFSADGGNSWEAKGPQGVTVNGYVTRIAIQPSTSNWFVGTSEGQIWESSSGGGVGTWHLINYHPDNARVFNMAFAPTNDNILYVTYQGSDAYRRIERLENTGSSWMMSYISHNLPSNVAVTAVAGDGKSSSIIYVGTDRGVFRGDVNSPTYDMWHPYNDGLPCIKITDLLVDNTSKMLCAATYGRGAWRVIT